MKLLLEGWRRFVADITLKEGGNAFKDSEGNLLTACIGQENVQPTLDSFLSNHLEPAGISSYFPLGSTGKKSQCGDLDIVVSYEDKKDLLGKLQSTLGNENAKLVGRNIAVRYPIEGSDGQTVQIDIMLDSNPEHTAWLMSGAGDGKIKGVFRNLLLAYVANIRSRQGDPHSKMSLTFPGGLQKKQLPKEFDPNDSKSKRKWLPVGDKVSEPGEILKELGINASPESVSDFESLLSVLEKSDVSEHLGGFLDYIAPFAARMPEEPVKQLISYLNKA